jgi:tRNA pseudouridine38-40 synthase
MPRYFIEVAYKGAAYSGFQTQHNANTIQSELEKALSILFRIHSSSPILLTGSSRTDAGVHAVQNFFHLDFDIPITPQAHYKLNAILPADIVIKSIRSVPQNAHCRFDALSRQYKYYIYQHKNPFLQDRAFYFPYKLDVEKMQEAATIVKEYTDFTSFSKRNTQVKTFICKINLSSWQFQDQCLIYNVEANRFLRGMVRALTATMLQVGRNKITLSQFRSIIESKDCTKASFAVPPHGLFLVSVAYPDAYF